MIPETVNEQLSENIVIGDSKPLFFLHYRILSNSFQRRTEGISHISEALLSKK